MKWNVFGKAVLPLLAAMIAMCMVMNTVVADESGIFTGTWVANGSQEPLPFLQGRNIALFKLAGHVNLKNEIGKESDYWSECLGLADSQAGTEARCTWRSPHGQEIYLTLTSKQMEEGSSVAAEIVGGTGSATGISGSLSFTWSSMSLQREQGTSVIGGYAKELSGSYTLP